MVIDKKIIESTGKEHPVLVFIGAASGDTPRYFTAIQNHFSGRLGCNTVNLVLTDKPTIEEIRKKILTADIVYVGGGQPTFLMEVLKETGADKVLVEAYNKGIVMSGNSAGGCVWFEYYGNDEDDDFDGTFDTFKTKKALGLVRGFFEPHWNTKPETGIDKDAVSRNAVQRMLARESKFGYGVDEGAAIMVQTDDNNNQTITEIISKPGAGTYKLCFPQQQHINTGKGRE